MAMQLRSYQREMVDATTSAHDAGIMRPVVVAPTGSGKSATMAVLAAEHVERTGTQAVIIVNRTELVTQQLETMRRFAPHIGVGVVAGAKNQPHSQVVIAMIQTLARSPKKLQPLLRAGLMIADECHLLSSKGAQGDVLDAFTCPKAGFTATLVRTDNGLAKRWDRVVWSKGLDWAIDAGHLADLDAIAVDLMGEDADEGDIESLAQAMHDNQGEKLILDAYVEHGSDESGSPLPAVAFLPSVQTAEDLATHANASGIRTAVIHGGLPAGLRKERLAAYERGELDLLSSVMILTVGFDSPRATVALIARPMATRGMFHQAVGRVLRPFPGKSRARVIDFFAATNERHLDLLIDLESRDACGCDCPCTGAKSCSCGCQIDEQSCDCAGFICDCGCKCSGLSKECACLCIDGQGEPCRCRKTPEPRPEKEEPRDIVYSMVAREMQLFTKSPWVWLRTPAGLLFLTVDDTVWCLWPGPGGLVRPSWIEKSGRMVAGDDDLTMDQAKAVCEDLAETYLETHDIPFGVHRGASWRSGKATEPAKALARRWGADVPEGARKGEVSDLISIGKVSAKLDTYFRIRVARLAEMADTTPVL